MTKLDFPLTKSWIFASLAAFGCANTPQHETPTDSTEATGSGGPAAHVIGVSATGSDGQWTFSVTIESDETGCGQYADWWELVSTDGELVYRRILDHSHPDDQPFTRAAKQSIDVTSTTELFARAHLAPGGYVGRVFGGSIDAGFLETQVSGDFASALASVPPQPEGCLF